MNVNIFTLIWAHWISNKIWLIGSKWIKYCNGLLDKWSWQRSGGVLGPISVTDENFNVPILSQCNKYKCCICCFDIGAIKFKKNYE